MIASRCVSLKRRKGARKVVVMDGWRHCHRASSQWLLCLPVQVTSRPWFHSSTWRTMTHQRSFTTALWTRTTSFVSPRDKRCTRVNSSASTMGQSPIGGCVLCSHVRPEGFCPRSRRDCDTATLMQVVGSCVAPQLLTFYGFVIPPIPPAAFGEFDDYELTTGLNPQV